MLGADRLRSLRSVAKDREACVLYDEVDLGREGILIHRYLFWPCEELTVEFVELALDVLDVSDARVRLGTAFIEDSEDSE